MNVRIAFTFVLAALFAIAPSAAAAELKKPNIVYIMADDLGWTDVSCYGTKYYETPNIDRLGAGGMKFTSGYTCGPNCQPTRAALMSGQYGPRTGVYTVGGIERFNWRTRPLRPVDNVTSLPLEKITLADAMKKAGYATAMFGKWHLGQQDEYHPSKRGFDEAIVSMGSHFDFNIDPKVDFPKGEYLADFLTNEATKDLSQNHDLAAVEPQRVKDLHQKLITWRKQVGAKLPDANVDFGKPVIEKPALNKKGKKIRKAE